MKRIWMLSALALFVISGVVGCKPVPQPDATPPAEVKEEVPAAPQDSADKPAPPKGSEAKAAEPAGSAEKPAPPKKGSDTK